MPSADPIEIKRTDRTRTWIALAIVGLGAAGIVVISWVALVEATDEAETSRLIFGSVLPLLGTWVGAVLAFYFTRDNLQAGSETALSAVRAAGLVSPDTSVSDVMIPVNRINPLVTNDDPAAKQVTLSSLYTSMKGAGQSRVPILSTKQVPLYVIHEPDIDKYCQARGIGASALQNETVQDVLDDSTIAPEISSFVAVAPTATLADARRELSKTLRAKDVFVTSNGQRTGSAIGWLTNSDLARAS